MRAAVQAIEKAKNPVLVIGAGANRKLCGRMLEQLVEKTGIPFLTTQMGKGVIDERHPSSSAARRCPPGTSSTARWRMPTASSMSATT